MMGNRLCPAYNTKETSHSLNGRDMVRFLALAVGVCAAILSPLPLSSLNASAQDISSFRLGTNLNEVNDYSPQLPFRDLFLFSREWITQCRVGVDPGCVNGNAFDTGEGGSLDLDENGWVRSLPAPASPVIFTQAATVWDLPPEFPTGTFIVLYEGSGSIEYALGATKDVGASIPGRDVVSVNVANGPIVLRIAATNPANYIRNIRFVRATDESGLATNRFSAAFLSQLQPYQVLRFMDWMRTNNSAVSAWSERAKPADSRYSTPRGVPPEIMVELSNTTGKAPWFTLPAQATNEFVQNFATVVRDNLIASLPVFLEYSNEIWNGAFSQGDFVEAQGVAEFSGQSGSGYTKRMNWYGKRSAEICNIWKGIFGVAANRVVCIIASQAANTFTGDEAMRCPMWSGGPCVSHGITALAIAPYVGDHIGQAENYAAVSAWPATEANGLPKLFRELTQGGEISGGPSGGALAESFRWIEDNKSLADQLGVALITYEGGQHLVGIGTGRDDNALTELFTRANRDTRMGSLYVDYLNGWRSRAGGLFMHFSDIGSYSRFGSWGALEKIGETVSPKYNALFQYATGTLPESPPSQSTRRVRVRVAGGGRVVAKAIGIFCGTRCSATVPTGTTIKLTAFTPPTRRLRRWRGACSHSRRVCAFTATRARTVKAEFVRR